MNEYIRLYFDMDDMTILNSYTRRGWRLVQVLEGPRRNYNDKLHLPYVAILEHSYPLPPAGATEK